MKKNVLVTILVLSVGSFLFSGTIQPSLSMRFNDIIETTADSGTVEPVLVVGLTMSLDEGVYAGFDSDGTDSRIFVSFDYGTMGMGIDANGEPQFTIGAKYSALSNLDVSLDYVINNLTTSGDDGSALPNELRMSLGVTF
tara:strand:+ start:43 stop:462 length:420 start_codon:yes stop_codon:yes gene_type:complete